MSTSRSKYLHREAKLLEQDYFGYYCGLRFVSSRMSDWYFVASPIAVSKCLKKNELNLILAIQAQFGSNLGKNQHFSQVSRTDGANRGSRCMKGLGVFLLPLRWDGGMVVHLRFPFIPPPPEVFFCFRFPLQFACIIRLLGGGTQTGQIVSPKTTRP